jgi:hypothetical protein
LTSGVPLEAARPFPSAAVEREILSDEVEGRLAAGQEEGLPAVEEDVLF